MMAKLQYRTISRRTVDGLSVDDKDVVFRDGELPGFGVAAANRVSHAGDGTNTLPARLC